MFHTRFSIGLNTASTLVVDTKLPLAGRLAILGTGLLPAIATGTMTVMLPSIADAFGNGSNGIEIKSVSTAVGLGMMIGAPFSGPLVDRLGRRPVLLVAGLVFVFCGCGIMAMSELWQIILARFIIGIASGALGVGITAVIGDHFSGVGQSRWLGFNVGVATFFILFLSPAVGALSDLNWRYGFMIYALAIPVLVAIAVGIPGGRRDPAKTRPAKTRKAEKLFPTFDETPWRAVLLAIFLGTLSMGTALYWPFRLRELGVESAREIALFGLPNALATGAAALSYGRFRRHLSVTRLFILGAAISSAGLVAVSLAQSPMQVLLGLTVEGVAIGLMTPNLTTFALMVSPPKARGRSIGLVKGALYGSPFLTQFALEPIAQVGGNVAALLAIAVLAATIAIVVAMGALAIPDENRQDTLVLPA